MMRFFPTLFSSSMHLRSFIALHTRCKLHQRPRELGDANAIIFFFIFKVIRSFGRTDEYRNRTYPRFRWVSYSRTVDNFRLANEQSYVGVSDFPTLPINLCWRRKFWSFTLSQQSRTENEEKKFSWSEYFTFWRSNNAPNSQPPSTRNIILNVVYVKPANYAFGH